MEFGQLHELKASRDDAGQSDQPDDGTSAVRSYGCVFCKRGFTTAQALGGHMNIHRKDRAKARPDSSSPSLPSNPDKKCVPLCSYFPFSNHPPHYYQKHEPPPQSGPSSYSPPSERTVRPSNGLNHGDSLRVSHMPRLCYLSEEDWRWGLSLQVGPSSEDGNKEKGQADADADEERLDLELRLGHER